MEPKLNVKISNLFMEPFDGPNPVDVDFAPQGMPLPGDYMDTTGNDAERNFQTVRDFQNAWAAEEDRDHAVVERTDAANLYNNPGAQVGPDLTSAVARPKASKQAQGFNNRQAHRDATLGVIASLKNDTLVGGRVYAKTAKSNVRGTIIAVGDREFSVIWDDRTASVERKNDYELVIKSAASMVPGSKCDAPNCGKAATTTHGFGVVSKLGLQGGGYCGTRECSNAIDAMVGQRAPR